MAYIEPLAYGGLRDSGTFRLDAKTTSTIKGTGDVQNIVGKTVAWVESTVSGEPMVGYGTAKAGIAGIVTAIRPATEGDSENFVVTVSWHEVFENIATASTSTTAVVGAGVVVDGKGGVETSATVYNAVCIAINSEKTACMIRML